MLSFLSAFLIVFGLVACDNDHVEGQDDNETEEKGKVEEMQENNQSENAEDVNDAVNKQEEQKINLAEDDEEDAKYLFENMTFEVKEDDEVLGTFTVDIRNLSEKHKFKLSDHTTVEIVQFYPDYYLNEEKEPASLSNYPFNPAFVFEVTKGDEINAAFVGIGIEVIEDDDSPLKFELIDFDAVMVDK